MRKIFLFSVVALATVFISSCEKDEFTTKENNKEDSFVVSEVNSIIDETNGLKSSSSQWGSYPLLSSTGNSARYFNTGTYAVKITRSIGDASTLTFRLVAQNQTNSSNAYLWAYKNDANNNQLYYSGVKTLVPGGSVSPIPDLSITGSQSIIYVFKVTTAGYYIFWYRTI